MQLFTSFISVCLSVALFLLEILIIGKIVYASSPVYTWQLTAKRRCVGVRGKVYWGQLQPIAVSRKYLTLRYFPATIHCVASHRSVYARELQVQEPMKTSFTSFIFSTMRACRSVALQVIAAADSWDGACDCALQSVATCMPGFSHYIKHIKIHILKLKGCLNSFIELIYKHLVRRLINRILKNL